MIALLFYLTWACDAHLSLSLSFDNVMERDQNERDQSERDQNESGEGVLVYCSTIHFTVDHRLAARLCACPSNLYFHYTIYHLYL